MQPPLRPCQDGQSLMESGFFFCKCKLDFLFALTFEIKQYMQLEL